MSDIQTGEEEAGKKARGLPRQPPSPGEEVSLESCSIPMAATFQIVWNLIVSLNPFHFLHCHNSSDLTGCVPVSLG